MPIKTTALLSKFGLSPKDALWQVQGTNVIRHWALERIAAQAGILFGLPTVVLANSDAAALVVPATMVSEDGKHRSEVWSIGEAALGVNYRVSGKQAAYPWAMAEKRAKDRCVLKLLEIEDAIDEADAEEQGLHPNSQERRAAPQTQVTTGRLPQKPDDYKPATRSKELKAKLYEALVGVEADEVDAWLRRERVAAAMKEMDEVDRLDVTRAAEMKRDGR